jgi:serine/threonine protein kinase/tetratricopeptide (TPR) repeat protein
VTGSGDETVATHGGSAGASELGVGPRGQLALTEGMVVRGRYLLERTIGEGGMAVVFQARDLEEERIALESGGTAGTDRLAIKFLRPELLSSALMEELRRTRTLVHQNIVRAGDCQQEGQLVFITMELLEGRTLDRLLDRDFAQGVPWDLARTLIAELGAGLSYPHDRGFVHCDLKPSNIFVTQAFRPKILDFGIARALRAEGHIDASLPSGLTPRYASPQMLRAWRAGLMHSYRPDRRDDIFALGCIVYELLTGTHPFGESLADAGEAAEQGWSLPNIEGLAAPQRRLLAEALAFDAAKRPSKVEHFVEGFVEGLPRQQRASRHPRWTSSRWLLTAASVAALGVMAAIVMWRTHPGLSPAAVTVTGSAGQPAVASPSAPARSVVVFGFSNLTGDPKDYFAVGISEEITNALTRINQLHVRSGPFLSPDGPPVDVSAVAHKLNVANVLQGSVRKAGSRVRVAVQLIDAGNGDHLWSQVYDRELKDALDLQAEIAERVAGTLNVTLLGDVRQHLAEGGTTNPDAYEAYLRARYGETFQDRKGLRSGLDALEEAIRLDPKFAKAYAFQADLQLQLASEWAGSPREADELLEGARVSAKKGVALAPDSGDAHLELALVLSCSLTDFRAADMEFRKALALEPKNGLVGVRYAEWAARFGRQEAATIALQAVGHSGSNYGIVLHLLRRFEEARPILKIAADREPDNPVVHSWVGFNELALGAPREALKYCQDKTFNYAQECMAIAYHQLGRRKDAQDMLALLMKGQGDKSPYAYASVYASWGDRERAMHYLQKAVDQKDGQLGDILYDPFLDSLRQDPRFQRIVTQLDLPK